MDPLTQGTLGAALPQATSNKAQVAVAGILGFVAGMTPDLDVLIRSDTDPLLYLEYHRQFTHSLIFIPVGGLLCALALHWIVGRRWGLTFGRTFLFCTLGYATHALLDACTSYGTVLFWPFSDERYSRSVVSIIDPVFTVPILVLVLLAGFRRKPWLARIALVWAVCYLGLGLVQHRAALAMGEQIAASRGHTPVRIEAKPSFANILVWKIIYETPERFYVDAVRANVRPRVFPGVSLAKLDVARDLPWLDIDTQQARDIDRFSWFSDGYISEDPERPNRIIDVRYSLLPNDARALWSIDVAPDAPPDAHASFQTHRGEPRERLGTLWRMVSGR